MVVSDDSGVSKSYPGEPKPDLQARIPEFRLTFFARHVSPSSSSFLRFPFVWPSFALAAKVRSISQTPTSRPLPAAAKVVDVEEEEARQVTGAGSERDWLEDASE